MRFRPFIPHTQIKHHPGEKSTLRNTEEESRYDEAREVLRYAQEGGDDAPCEHEGWEPETGCGALEDYVAGDFEEDLEGKVSGGWDMVRGMGGRT